MMRSIFACFLFLVFVLPGKTLAHVQGVTDTHVQIENRRIRIVFTLPDAVLTTNERSSGHSQESIIRDAFSIDNNHDACLITVGEKADMPDISAAQFTLSAVCDRPLQVLGLEYHLAAPGGISTENFVRISLAGRDKSITFDSRHRRHEVPVAYLLTTWGAAPPRHTDTLFSRMWQSRQYFPVGLQHILTGFDHLTFLLGLLLLPLRIKPLLALISTFTVSHSLTLALSALDIVRIPNHWIEPVIALSIVYVALENLHELRRYTLATEVITPLRRRLAITFFFGLVHGFGFSGVLNDIGLGDHVVGALLFFNLGVESGQLLVLLFVFPVLWLWFCQPSGILLARLGSVAAGIAGIVWMEQRVQGWLQIWG